LRTKAPATASPYDDLIADWIFSRLATIDQGMMEMIDRSYSKQALDEAAIAAGELGSSLRALGYNKGWKLAVRLEHAFQHPFEKSDVTERLVVDVIKLRFELPCSTFL